MVSKKSKIVFSVKVSRMEFVSLPIADQLQPNFYKLILCIGVSTPPQNHPFLFHQAPSPLNLETVQPTPCPPFLGSPLLYIGFLLHLPKNQIFQWTGGSNFSSLTPSHLLKVTKFLVKIFQFIFLVMTKKNIFENLVRGSPPLHNS